MSEDKLQRSREIERLIDAGRYDDAEDLLKDSVIPNTGALQDRIEALRLAAQPAPVKLTLGQRLRRVLVPLLVLVAIAGGVLLIAPPETKDYALMFTIIGFIFMVPRYYLAKTRGDRLNRYVNRSRYQRPGYGRRR